MPSLASGSLTTRRFLGPKKTPKKSNGKKKNGSPLRCSFFQLLFHLFHRKESFPKKIREGVHQLIQGTSYTLNPSAEPSRLRGSINSSAVLAINPDRNGVPQPPTFFRGAFKSQWVMKIEEWVLSSYLCRGTLIFEGRMPSSTPKLSLCRNTFRDHGDHNLKLDARRKNILPSSWMLQTWVQALVGLNHNYILCWILGQ